MIVHRQGKNRIVSKVTAGETKKKVAVMLVTGFQKRGMCVNLERVQMDLGFDPE